MVLQSVALDKAGEKDRAVQVRCDALALAEPGGFIRLFVDEGASMAQLLTEATGRGLVSHYAGKLLGAFKAAQGGSEAPPLSPAQPLV